MQGKKYSRWQIDVNSYAYLVLEQHFFIKKQEGRPPDLDKKIRHSASIKINRQESAVHMYLMGSGSGSGVPPSELGSSRAAVLGAWPLCMSLCTAAVQARGSSVHAKTGRPAVLWSWKGPHGLGIGKQLSGSSVGFLVPGLNREAGIKSVLLEPA